MTILIRFTVLPLLAFGAAFPATGLAQSKPDLAPLSASAAAAPLDYASVFADFRSDKELPPVSWKDSNAKVAQPHKEHDEHAGHDMSAMAHGDHAKPAAKPETNKKDPHQGHQHKE